MIQAYPLKLGFFLILFVTMLFLFSLSFLFYYHGMIIGCYSNSPLSEHSLLSHMNKTSNTLCLQRRVIIRFVISLCRNVFLKITINTFLIRPNLSSSSTLASNIMIFIYMLYINQFSNKNTEYLKSRVFASIEIITRVSTTAHSQDVIQLHNRFFP